MRMFITADTHLLGDWKNKCSTRLAALWHKHQPDGLVVAGDIAHSSEAAGALKTLRRIVGDSTPVAVCMGNHDLWASKRAMKKCLNPEDIIARSWIKTAADFGVTLLDQENANFASCTVAGAYGHYDYGFACRDLRIAGKVLNHQDYAKGISPNGHASWNDKRFLPCARGDIAEAQRQAAGLDARLNLAAARNLPIIAITHTAPFEALIGYPADPQNPDSFYRAYSGSTLAGAILSSFAANIALAVCGHTHRQIDPLRIAVKSGQSILAANVGSEYARPEAIVFDTATLVATRASL